MKSFIKATIIIFLLAIATQAFPSSNTLIESNFYANTEDKENKEDIMNVTLVINGSSYLQMKDVPKTGLLEVYNIIGRRMASVNLKNAEGGIYIDLPSGLYFVKAGKTSMKMVIK